MGYLVRERHDLRLVGRAARVQHQTHVAAPALHRRRRRAARRRRRGLALRPLEREPAGLAHRGHELEHLHAHLAREGEQLARLRRGGGGAAGLEERERRAEREGGGGVAAGMAPSSVPPRPPESMSTKASWDIVREVPLRSRVAQSILRRVSTQAPLRAMKAAGRAPRDRHARRPMLCSCVAGRHDVVGDVVGDSACLGDAQRAERRPAAPHRAGTLAERRGSLESACPSPRPKLQPEGGGTGRERSSPVYSV